MFNHQTGSEAEANVDENGDCVYSSDKVSPENTAGKAIDGIWGEKDTGGPVNVREAMNELEELRKELSYVSKTRSRGALSKKYIQCSNMQGDVESQHPRHNAEDDADEEDFELCTFLKGGHFEKRTDVASAKKIGVVYKHLTVEGVGATATFVKTLPQAVFGTFGPNLYRLCARFIPGLPLPGANSVRRCLINDFSGVVRNGEMLLVLGRPGSGCSTFLKAIANRRGGYAAVTGDVHYGGIDANEQIKSYRGEVVYNEEDDQHLPTLTVEQTLRFSLLNKTKKKDMSNIPIIIRALLKMFRISHTRYTLVGNDFIRGISGGERKRVSIAETLATKSTVVAWDNSTRGLDASTALDYANSLRIMTNISDRTTIVTLYQAGEEIFNLMDKVLVIDEGRMVFSGAANAAKAYFQNLGYYCPDRMTTADFLTACTDPKERRFRRDFKGRPIPKGSIEMERAFRGSEHYQEVLKDIESYEQALKESGYAHAREFKNIVQDSRSKTVSKRSPYTVSFISQVLACTQREFWLTINNRSTLYTKMFILVAIGLIAGSAFHGQPLSTDGAFSRGGTSFFAITFPGWLQLAELKNAVSGRSIISRHNDYGFYRPSAVILGRIIQDFIVLLIQVITFSIIIYFMSSLDVEPGKFFTFVLFLYATTICITSLYRMFAALGPTMDDGIRFSGTALNLLLFYTGYVIPKPQLLSEYIWFGWLYYLNPIAYSFEGVLTNEFSGRTMACTENMTVPRGPGFEDPAYRTCSLPGSQPGSLSVSGADYIAISFQYTRANLWRNFGVLISFTFLYILVTAAASELFDFTSGSGGALEFKRSKRAKRAVKEAEMANDEEKATAKAFPSYFSHSGSSSSTIIGFPLSGLSGDSDSNGDARAVASATVYLDKEDKIKHSVTTVADRHTISTPGTKCPSSSEKKDKATKKHPREQEPFKPTFGSKGAFTWKDVEYIVPYLGGNKKLLNKVSGFAKSGSMTALMGASGAGKTTLLNTLSQRQTTGSVSGKMLVDGQSLGIGFRRRTGFCEQRDLHDGTATVREAIEFSAILRQEHAVSRANKIEYVDKIIDILELGDIEDALIRCLGVEQKKRVTIGVELAAKPLLLFLDEPTSGLDSQSAFTLVSFLRNLAESGQAIVCTIHQPSSILIQQFDNIVALNPGGNVIYNGPVGENGTDVIDYFGLRGVQCPPTKNVAEFILETAAKRPKGKDGKRLNWNDEWLNSTNKQEVDNEIARIYNYNKSKSKAPAIETQYDFASPVWLQTIELTKRTFINHWRDPSYLYGKIFVSVIMGIFNGFTFYQLGNSIIDMQNRMFTTFLILLIPPTIVNAVMPKFFDARDLWETRELPSRIYGWIAFCTANVVAEIPISIIGATIYWLLWYWPSGLPHDSGTAGYVYLMTVLWFLFQASWGQWISAFGSTLDIISNVLPFFFVTMTMFNGVLIPYGQLPGFWRDWMYWANFATYYVGGTVSATLKSITVTCTPNEATYFHPPPNSTCSSYAQSFITNYGGYLTNPNATGDCGYCQYKDGVEYMKTLNIELTDKWKYAGIFMMFCVSNWGLVYFFVFTVRVKRWGVGVGSLLRGTEKGVSAVKVLFGKKGKKMEEISV